MEKTIETTVGSLLREQAAKYGEREFIVFPNRGVRYTFAEVDKKADEIAKGLLAAGLKKGDHIGIWAHNIPDWAAVFYAAARAGIVAIPININCKHQEIGYILSQADIDGLFFADTFRNFDLAQTLYEVIPELKNSEPGKLSAARFPRLKTVAAFGAKPHAGMYTLEDIAGMGSRAGDGPLRAAEAAVRNTDTLAIIYTSGTTGVPKGAMLTHRGMLNSAYFAYRPGRQPNERTVVFNPLPYFYITALSEGLLGGLLFGYKLVGIEAFDPALSLETIQKERCDWLFGVPSVFMAMIGHPRFGEFDLGLVKRACVGGTACPAEMLKTVFARLNLETLYHVYGLTEVSPFICDAVITSPSDPGITTVGAPIEGIEVSVRDGTGRECPTNTEGEICARGYGVMQGYYKMEEATREAIDSDGWLHTGDLGHLTGDGRLAIGGRKKDLIIRGGENVYPKEIENLLLAMPGVHDAQVAGIPSEKYGEAVGAFVILKPGAAVSEQDVKDFCKERISFFKNPQHVFFTESFPLSGNGKVQKFKLSGMGQRLLKDRGIRP